MSSSILSLNSQNSLLFIAIVTLKTLMDMSTTYKSHFIAPWAVISGKFDHVFLLVGRDKAVEKATNG